MITAHRPTATQGAPEFFVSYPDLVRRARDLERRFPDLVTVRDIGDSGEKRAGLADRDIIAIELTNKRITGTKPVVEHIAGVHSGEIANPALLLDWAEQITASYGHDATATAMLDSREFALIPMVNPDGNARVTESFATGDMQERFHRFNAGPPVGVDLNRNFDFRWGQGGSDPNHDGAYRGAYPASEAEVQAVQGYTELRKPSLFIDWHSYSGLVLRPFGNTAKPAKDERALKAVGDRFAAINGYTSQRNIDLYPTSGTTVDWAYGKHGIPAFCVETGIATGEGNGHAEVTTPEGYNKIRRENIPVLWDAALLGSDPLHHVGGPQVNFGVDLATRTVGAWAWSTGADIKRVEMVFDPRVPEGRGIALKPADGALDSAGEEVEGKLPKDFATRTVNDLLYVRAQDIKGVWGVASPVFVHPDPDARG